MAGPRSKRRKVVATAIAAAPKAGEPLQWILGDALTAEAFLETHWGRKPVHVARGEAWAAEELFDAETLVALADSEELEYGQHLNVVNCPDGKEKRVVHTDGKRATPEEIRGFLKPETGCTIQFFQPQRYVDALWERMAALESQFSTLWGANVYLTAAGTQGLAPHYDDVEVFVLQTQGRKRWKVHGPSEPFQELALEHSKDLETVGPLLLEVELKPGDLLYLPRGTTHYAVATSGSDPSVHITVSTHQEQSYFNFMDKALPKLLDAAASSDVEFRRGVPVGFLKTNGVVAASRDEQPGRFVRQTAALLRRIADSLEASRAEQDESVAQAFHEAVDEFALDFVGNRLPAPQSESAKALKKVSVGTAVHFRLRDWVYAAVVDPTDGSSVGDDASASAESDGGDGGSDEGSQDKAEQEGERGSESGAQASDDDSVVLRVYNSASNSRKHHMGPRLAVDDGAFVDLALEARPFVDALFAAGEAGVLVSDENAEWAASLAAASMLAKAA